MVYSTLSFEELKLKVIERTKKDFARDLPILFTHAFLQNSCWCITLLLRNLRQILQRKLSLVFAYMDEREKPHLSLVVIGHADAGE